MLTPGRARVAACREKTSVRAEMERVRLPRCIGPDLVVSPFSHHIAAEQMLLYRLNGYNLVSAV